MRWDEIDRKKRTWLIPAEKSKNKKPHLVYLSDLANNILDECYKNSTHEDSPWIFPSINSPEKHITDAAINKAIYRQFTPEKDNPGEGKQTVQAEKHFPFKGVEKFTPHDLRRTAASHMTGLGIPRLVVSKILNHVENSVTAIYDRHTYEKEKQQALETWSSKLKALIQPDKIF